MINNIKKIILLINLFQNREYVTLSDAENICGINKRSFYRYINTLSEIDFPIYRDNNVRGYRLSQKTVKRKFDFCAQELVLLTLGLQLFSNQTNSSYRKEIKALFNKILSLANFQLENNLQVNELDYENTNEKKAVSSHIIQNLLEIAIAHKFKITIQHIQNKNIITTTIDTPNVEFHQNWLVSDHLTDKKILLEAIEHIEIK